MALKILLFGILFQYGDGACADKLLLKKSCLRPIYGADGGMCMKKPASSSGTRSGKLIVWEEPQKMIVWSPFSQRNNCLLACFLHKFPHRLVRDLRQTYVSMADIRLWVLRCLPSQKLDFSHVMELAHYFQVRCWVYSRNGDLLFGTHELSTALEGPHQLPYLELILSDEHYYLVHQWEHFAHKCDVCGLSPIKDIERHECNRERLESSTERMMYATMQSSSSMSSTRKAYIVPSFIRSDQRRQKLKEAFEASLPAALYFDFETVMIDGKFQVYAVGCFWSKSQLYKDFYGPQALGDFLSYLHSLSVEYHQHEGAHPDDADYFGETMSSEEEEEAEEQEGRSKKKKKKKRPIKWQLVSFNGAKFDHYMLLEGLADFGVQPDQILMSNNRILMMELFGCWRTCDMYLFCGPEGLDKVCKSYGVSVSKDIFPHLFPSKWEDVYYVGPWLESSHYPEHMRGEYERVLPQWKEEKGMVFRFEQECRAYLTKDVMCLVELTMIFARSMMECTSLMLFDHLTISHLAFEYWRQTLPIARWPDRRLHHRLLNFRVSHPLSLVHHEQSLSKDAGGRVLPVNTIFLPETEAEYDFIQRGIYGGRTHPIKRCFISADVHRSYEEIHDFLIDGDVRSLYPTAMMYSFPVGKPKWITREEHESSLQTYQAMIHVRAEQYQQQQQQELQHPCLPPFEMPLSMWEVLVRPNKCMVIPALPRKNEFGHTAWDLQDSLSESSSQTQVYTSVDIDQGLRYGYEITLIKGLVWPERDKVFATYVETVFAEKNEEDIKLKNKDPSYNPARRNISKLRMNALYGKMLQRVQGINVEIFDVHDDLTSFLEDHHEVELHEVKENWVVASGQRKQKEKLMTKPSQLGAFVLSYSRLVMNNYFDKLDPYRRRLVAATTEETLSEQQVEDVQQSMRHSIYYTDTDSLFLSSTLHWDMIKDDFVDGLGKLDDELKGGKIVEAYFLAPKLYGILYVTADNQRHTKLRAKGIPASLLTMNHFRDMFFAKEAVEYTFDSMRRTLLHTTSTGLQAGQTEFSVSVVYNQTRTLNKNESTCRVILPDDIRTVPHGFNWTYLDVDLLLSMTSQDHQEPELEE